MRILIHGINYSPEPIGIGKYTGEMAEWLAMHGHEVRVVTAPPYYPQWRFQPPYRGWSYRIELMNGVGVYRCPLWVPERPRGLSRILHLLSWAISSIPISLRLVFWRPDVVFTVEPTIFGAVVALLAARLAGARCWLHVQDFELEAALGLGMVQSGRVVRVAAAIEAWLMTRFDCVSSISGAMLRRIAEKGVSDANIVSFPNWVDCDELRPLPTEQSLRGEWEIPFDRKVVLYAGNVGNKQGLDVLLECAEIYMQSRPDVLFLLVGDGSAKKELERRADAQGLTNVLFKPLQPIDKLAALLSTADVHVILQRKGAADLVMPSKLTGIMAAGGVALVTAEPGTELYHVVTDNNIGLVVEPESVSSLRQGLETLIDNDELCVSLKERSRLYAESVLAKRNILDEFENHLNMIHKA